MDGGDDHDQLNQQAAKIPWNQRNGAILSISVLVALSQKKLEDTEPLKFF